MLGRLFLWLFVFFLCLDIGAGLYETRVIAPMWKSALVDHIPDAETYLRLAPNAGERFWIFITPLLGLLALLTFVTGLKVKGAEKPWRLFASGLEFLMVACTLLYFVPNIRILLDPGHHGLAPEVVAAKTQTWLAVNWLRVLVTLTALIAALRTLQLSGRQDEKYLNATV
jgi:hypothetical protein